MTTFTADQIHNLLKLVMFQAGQFKVAEAAELGIDLDEPHSAKEFKDDLNKNLSELWKMISTEPEPKDFHMCEMSEMEDEDE